MQQKKDKKEVGFGMETLEPKSADMIKVFNGACMQAEIKYYLPVLSGRVGGKKVEL